jgi:predicted nucleic acid-binding protein
VLDRYKIHYTPEVAEELKVGFPSGREFMRLAGEGLLVEVKQTKRNRITEFVKGERSAINLALEHPGWILLIDDRRPFLEASKLGIKVICTSVVVIDLYDEGILKGEEALEILARLQAMRTLSPELITAALRQLASLWKE